MFVVAESVGPPHAVVIIGSVRAGHERSLRATLRSVPLPSTQPSASTPDADIARAIMAGQGESFEAELVSRFSRRVFLYGMRHLRDPVRAEDLAQDVMTTALTKLRRGEVREPERIGSFILGTARVMTRDVRRRERRHEEVATAAARERDAAMQPTELGDTQKLAQALTALSERERAVIVLTFMEELSAPEIAETFGLQPGNVRVIRHRAIARLGDLMGVDELRDEGGMSGGRTP